MARRDIWLFSDGRLWWVRGPHGGDGGREVSYDFTDEGSARKMVDRMMKTSAGTWRDLTEADQRATGGQWRPLGTFALPAGDANRVAVSRWSSAAGLIIADAVRLTRI